MKQYKAPIDIDSLINTFISHGLSEGLVEIGKKILNAAMVSERQAFLQAEPYERNAQRNGYANGFKPKTIDSSLGRMRLDIPQVRDSDNSFYPSFLNHGSRFEKTLKLAIIEMYLNGISTRKVTKVINELGGCQISSSQVSKLTQELDTELEMWRNRALPEISHLLLDATYMHVRKEGHVTKSAILIAIGIVKQSGKRMILGVSCAASESEIHWREFLSSIKERGIGRPELIVSDAHQGLKDALTTVFTGVAWQRCQFHLQQNALDRIKNKEARITLGEEIRNVFNSSDINSAKSALESLVKKYEKPSPALSNWLEQNIPQGFSVYIMPRSQQVQLRTTNMLENLNKQLKRRTKAATLFPNEKSVLRLVSALLQEISDDWETGRVFLKAPDEKAGHASQ